MLRFEIWFIAAVFLLSATITGLMIGYARRTNLMDIPNQRSSHVIATPRGGGLSIVLCFLGSVVVFWVLDDLATRDAIGLLAAGFLVAAIGFVDDHRHISVKWRFLVQTFAAVIVVLQLGGLPPLPIGDVAFSMGLVGDALLVFFAVWFTNAFNFMDGIDGIAASEAFCIAGGVIFIGLPEFGSTSLLAAVLAASCLGFLTWNWPPAKIFMGDVGSAFLGLILIALGLYSAHHGFISLWSWLILGGVFFVDSTVTLVTRMLRRDEWLSAHRSHAYQNSARRFGSHARVTVGVVAINVGWLLPIAFAANENPGRGWWLLIVAWLPLVAICAWLGAGRQKAEVSA